MLNSAWGKHAQRPIMTEAKVLDLENDSDKVDSFFRNILDHQYQFQDATSLNNNKVMYRYKTFKAKVDLHGGYLPAAIFVTAYGRLQLWREVHKLGKRVLYFDTDSIIYVRDPDGYNIPQGHLLGEWEREKIDIQNGGIKTFVGLGPKSYALKTWKNGKTVVKAKGLSLKHAHSNLVNFEVMEKMAKEYLETGEIVKVYAPQQQFSFSLDPQQGMRTAKALKVLQINPREMKGQLVNEYLYPFGYETGRE